MDSPPIDELVARVLAWHNGHRLTRRIAAHHVSGVGVVALPFVPQGERTDRSDWVAGFSEDFIHR